MIDDLIAAYRGTRYAVLGADGGTVAEALIGRHVPAVDAVLDAHGARSGVFITAWNPRSEPTHDDVNADAHARMAMALASDGLVALPHAGFGEDPAWRAEHGFFVLDLPEEQAVALAVAHEQNAVVVVERGEAARLVLTSVLDA
ncbi:MULTISPECIES: DUF3293 domain-containing protein [Aeromicrobium]|uniref:DUF3293 domain-containing protein n=1 Tax=Aeromicrobium TaxID=2040 RepID=UPI0006FB715F|nr:MULTISPECIES: DUF3293 domain-containing protein [Aeromicrobium]KQX74032.1 hypothetical protein ASD10_01865 [Aeromicrobium sp. Root472D3]MBD8608793.1 DUF3293 domain-containing protein [Aeromicrobium sp. CFBP 8757]MCL8252215.1 DUF3293 domain-containing protein [Aeromicrobium fastidiosum]